MKCDVVIIGGGPAGAATAMYLAREGIQSVIVEKSPFPRYHVGESMSGECGAVLRDLGLEDRMQRCRFPQKQGVKVYGPRGDEPWWVGVAARDKDKNLEPVSTWQVTRAEFDKLMLDSAVERGATVIPGKARKPMRSDDGAVRGVEVETDDGGIMQIESELALDCTGLSSFFAVHGVTGPKYLGDYDKQIAIFTQFAGCIRDDGSDMRQNHPDNTIILYKTKYHWAWFIPVTDELVSVGVVTPAAYFKEKNESKIDFIKREIRELNPELSRRVPDLTLADDIHVIPNYSFQVAEFTGPGYMCVGDSHRFVDPIFSFGLYVAVKEAQLCAPVIRDYLNGKGRDLANPFADYQLYVERGIDVLEDMIDLFWEQPFAFAVFAHRRFTGEIVDIFAGRVYEEQPNAATSAFRKMLARERVYDDAKQYSVPIGSRYRPERAPLWRPDSLVPGTEKWILE